MYRTRGVPLHDSVRPTDSIRSPTLDPNVTQNPSERVGSIRRMPVLIPIPADLYVALLLVGAALLAGWTLVRFEHVGPRTLGGALLAKGAALLLLVGFPTLVERVGASGVPDRRLVIILALALPTFTYLFLTAGWFARAVLRRFGGGT
jgi:hypothetical protein